jgi:hypothetical protein
MDIWPIRLPELHQVRDLPLRHAALNRLRELRLGRAAREHSAHPACRCPDRSGIPGRRRGAARPGELPPVQLPADGGYPISFILRGIQ